MASGDNPVKTGKTSPQHIVSKLHTASSRASLNLVKCKMCGMSMRAPKQLPCLHSFCEICLINHRTNIADEQNKLKLDVSCPECGFLVYTIKESNNIKQFVEDLPTDSVISNLLSERAVDSDLCAFVTGCKVLASFWCGYCAIPLCDEHNELHSTLTTTKIPHITTSFNQRRNICFPFESCRFHGNEMLNFFCLEDSTLCCKLCRKFQHRTCDRIGQGVQPINSAAVYIKENPCYQKLSPLLDKIKMDCVTLSEDRQQQIDELEKQLKQGKSEISLLRKSMNKYIEGIDETARSELDTAYRQKVKAGSEDKDEIDVLLRSVQYYKQILLNIHKRSTGTQAVPELVQLKQRVDSTEEAMSSKRLTSSCYDLSIRTMKEPSTCIPRMGYVRKGESRIRVEKPVSPSRSAKF